MKSLRLSWLLWSVLLFFVLVGAPRPAASNVTPDTWTGANSNDWFTAGNWSYFGGQQVPDSSVVNTEIDSFDQNTGLPFPYGFPVIGTSGTADNIYLYGTLNLVGSNANLSLGGNGPSLNGYLEVESNGTLNLVGPNANLSLAGNLSFDPGSTYTSGPGATITLTGSNVYINSSNVNMSNTTLSFTNPSASDTLDVGVANFTLGTLTLAGGATVTLAGNNSVTVTNLDLGGSSTLYLNNDTITVGTETGTGQVLPGRRRCLYQAAPGCS